MERETPQSGDWVSDEHLDRPTPAFGWRDASNVRVYSLQKFVEDQYTILELTGKIEELQNEINCMNDSRDFQDAESVRSGQSHVAS